MLTGPVKARANKTPAKKKNINNNNHQNENEERRGEEAGVTMCTALVGRQVRIAMDL